MRRGVNWTGHLRNVSVLRVESQGQAAEGGRGRGLDPGSSLYDEKNYSRSTWRNEGPKAGPYDQQAGRRTGRTSGTSVRPKILRQGHSATATYLTEASSGMNVLLNAV